MMSEEQQEEAATADATKNNSIDDMAEYFMMYPLKEDLEQEDHDDDGSNSFQELMRSRLLQISHFLTLYQQFYTCQIVDDGPIVLEDLQQVLRYRALKQQQQVKHCKNAEKDASELHVTESPPFRLKIDEYHEKLKMYQPSSVAAAATAAKATVDIQQQEYEKQQKQQENHRRIVKIDKLWRRMQVWTCKALAQQLLVLNIADDEPSLERLEPYLWMSYPLSLPLASHAATVLPLVNDVNIQIEGRGQELPPFAKLFDQTYHSDPNRMNGLIVPPNHYNCREYARLCSLIAQLPNDQARRAVHLSPLALNARAKQQHRSQQKQQQPQQPSTSIMPVCCQLNFHWRAHDLVALWLRAQRNPEALRHLVQLFCVTPVDHDTNDKDSAGRHCGGCYRAEFLGNHELVYKRSIVCSTLADKIRAWAIANQVLCTYPQFVEYWQQQRATSEGARSSAQPTGAANVGKEIHMTKNDHKRKREQVSEHHHGVAGVTSNNKRRQRQTFSEQQQQSPKQDVMAVPDGAQETQLLHTCHLFLLRTWARRHAKALELLYKHPWQVQQDKHPPLVSMETLKAHIKKQLPRTLDHNLLRIERRIAKSKYGVEKPFKNTVTNLVKAFRHCLLSEIEQRHSPSHNISDGVNLDELNDTLDRLRQAQDDWEMTCSDFETIWNEEGAVAAARSLFAWTNTDEASISTTTKGASNNSSRPAAAPAAAGEVECAILSSAPAPWLNICCKCNDPVKEEGSYRACACCEKVWHTTHDEEAQPNTVQKKSLKSVISACPLLGDFFLVTAPSLRTNPNFNLPNYSGDRASEITWTSTRVHLTRERATAGTDELESWGLTFFDSRECEERMNAFLSGKLTMWKWEQKLGPLLRIPHIGMIVSKILHGSPSARSSLQVGDVIVAVRPGACDKSAVMKEHEVVHIKKEQFMLLFKQGSTELNLFIQRPSRPIVDEAQACFNDLMEVMEIPWAALNQYKSEPLHFCPSCCCDSENKWTTRSARDTIRNCKAVIRRLGSEWYGPSFWYENHVRAELGLSLDLYGEQASPAIAGDKRAGVHTNCVSLGRLDHMMDELLDRQKEVGVKDNTVVSRDSPLVLLSRGVNLLLREYQKSPDDQDTSSQSPAPPTVEMRKALASDFFRLFLYWCLAHIDETGISVKGPYPHALRAADPADTAGRCCPSYRARQVSSVGDGSLCCASDSSVAVQPTASPDNNETFHLRRQIQRYQQRARLVGCSILLLPDDPLLVEETNILYNSDELVIDHCGRPFEFIVASYLPSSLKECGTEEDAGVFYLLPIVTVKQLQYLLQRCKFRQPAQDGLKEKTLDRWRQDGLLNLEGVVQLSFKELTVKVEATAGIIGAVSHEVARQARCPCAKAMAQLEPCCKKATKHDIVNDDGNVKVVPCTYPRCRGSVESDMSCSVPWQYCATSDVMCASILIETGSQVRSPVMVEMMDSKSNERIRGTGHAEEVSQKHLIDLPKSGWNDTLVKGRCTMGNDKSSRKTFIGRVKFPSGSSVDDDGKVDVCVVHLKSMGPIHPFWDLKALPRKLKVVDYTSNDTIKALKAERMSREPTFASENSDKKCMASFCRINEIGTQGMPPNSELLKIPGPQFRIEDMPVKAEWEGVQLKLAAVPAKRATMDPRKHEERHLKPAATTTFPAAVREIDFKNSENSQLRIQEKATVNDLAGRLCDSQHFSTAPIGVLPGGQPLYWFSSDPRAVFISPLRSMLQDDPISESALARETRKYELRVKRNFEQLRGSLQLGQPGTFNCIWGCTVASDNGSSLCLSFESMAKLRDHLRLHHSYVQEKDPEFILDHKAADLVRVDDSTTLTRICRGLDAAARARFPALKEFAESTSSDGSDEARQQSIRSNATASEFDGSIISRCLWLTSLFKADGETYSGSSHCHHHHHQHDALASEEDKLGCCRLGCERVLLPKNDEYRDTGCLPIGDICLNEIEAYPADRGDIRLDDARSMLLALASNLPESTRKMKSKNSELNDICPQMQLWTDNGFSSWRLFVLACQDVRSLVQAFVALLFSIDIELLPDWWKTQGLGWSALQADWSLSCPLLHLQVFEVALVEFSVVSSVPFKDIGVHIPQELIPFPYGEQVSRTLERAKAIGLDRFNGEYKFYCSVCQDGGDLMCCELCSNVGHASCYNLTTASSQVNDFVCYACMADVATMYQSRALVINEEEEKEKEKREEFDV